jgi:hypothetical protein
MTKTVNLGPEHDEALQHALVAILREMGAAFDDASWALGGSQEVVSRSVTLGGSALTVQAETYLGLTLCGDVDLVDEIAKRTWRQCGGA